MTTLSGGFAYRDVEYYRSETDPELFHFIPGSPAPERDSSGRPVLTLLQADDGGLLQLSLRWDLGPVLQEELRRDIAARFPDLDPTRIRLDPMTVTVAEVRVIVGDGAGAAEVVSTARSSGFPPYSTVLQARLTPEQTVRAAKALDGATGFLMVAYHGTVADEVETTTEIREDVTAERSELSGSSTTEQRRLVQSSAGFEAAATRTAMRSVPVERSGDVSSWLGAATGRDHLTRVTGALGISQPEPATVTPASSESAAGSVPVRLDFEPGDAPIAFVQLRRGGGAAVLRPPGFQPVTLPPAEPGTPLTVTVNYTDGGPSFETTLAEPEAAGWALSPKDLGLTHVVVDGSARRSAGAKSARIRVRYRADRGIGPEDRTIQLRHDAWAADWYVASRGPDLGGVLEYEWKETVADGSVVNHDTVTTGEAVVTL